MGFSFVLKFSLLIVLVAVSFKVREDKDPSSVSSTGDFAASALSELGFEGFEGRILLSHDVNSTDLRVPALVRVQSVGQNVHAWALGKENAQELSLEIDDEYNTPVVFGEEALDLFKHKVKTKSNENTYSSDGITEGTPLTGLTAAYQLEQQLNSDMLDNPSQPAQEILTEVLVSLARLFRKSGVQCGADVELLRAHFNHPSMFAQKIFGRYGGAQGTELWDKWIRELSAGDMQSVRNFIRQRLDGNPRQVSAFINFVSMPMSMLKKANKYRQMNVASQISGSKGKNVTGFLAELQESSDSRGLNINAANAFVNNFDVFTAPYIQDVPYVSNVLKFRSEETADRQAKKDKAQGNNANESQRMLNCVKVKMPSEPGKPPFENNLLTNSAIEQNQWVIIRALLRGVPMKMHLSSTLPMVLSTCKALLDNYKAESDEDQGSVEIGPLHWIALGGVFTATMYEYHTFMECGMAFLLLVNHRFGLMSPDGFQLQKFGDLLSLPGAARFEELAGKIFPPLTREELDYPETQNFFKSIVVANIDNLAALGKLLVTTATHASRF